MSHAVYLQPHRACTARPKHSEEKRHQVILLWTCAVCLCVVTGALYILYKTVTSKTVAAVSASPNTNSVAVAKETPKRGPATRTSAAPKEKKILPVTNEEHQRIDNMLDILALANAPSSTTGESSTDTTTDNSLIQPIEQKQKVIAISTANSNLTPPPAAEQESAPSVIPALQTESQKTADAGQLIIPGLRTWTREDGATLEGKFLGYKEGSIDEIRILKKDDLKEYPVSLSSLVDADRHFVMMEITKSTPAAPKVTDVVPPPAETKSSPAAKPVDRANDLPKTGSAKEIDRRWTLRDGNRYDGSFLRVHNGSVVIKLKQGGRPKLLPYSSLSMADQVYVDEIKPSAEGKNTGTTVKKSGKLSEKKPQVERPTALKEVFDKLNSAAVNPIPTEIQEFIAIYDDEANKARATRLDALKNIGSFREQAAPALPFLRNLLLGEDLEVRQTVFQALENIGQPSEPTYIAILEAMKDPREFVREQLWHGPHVRTTKSKYQTLACYALTALGRLGSKAEEATPILLEIATQSDRVFNDWQRSGETDQPFQVPDATFLGSEALEALRAIGSGYKDVNDGLVNLSIMATRRLRYLDRNDRTPRDMWDKSPHVQLRNTLLNQCVVAFAMLGGAMTPPPKEVVPPACTLLEGHYAVRESIGILGRVGPDATDALKYLRPLLADSKFGPPAEQAIAQITRKEP